MFADDSTRCLGRTGFSSDSYLCPIRNSCLRYVLADDNKERAMHLCKPTRRDAYLPLVVLTREVA